MHTEQFDGCPEIQRNRGNVSTVIDFDIIEREIRLRMDLQIAREKLDIMIDTGAQLSILKPQKLFSDTKVNCAEKIFISGVTDYSKHSTVGKVRSLIYLNDIPFLHEFHIVGDDFNIHGDGILGSDFLIKIGANIDFQLKKLRVQLPLEFVHENHQERYKSSDYPTQGLKNIKITKKVKNESFYEDFRGNFEKEVTLQPIKLNANVFSIKAYNCNKNEIREPNKRMQIILNSIDMKQYTKEQTHILEEICFKFSNAFYIEGDEFKHTKIAEHFIELKPGTTPIFTRQYRIPECHKKEIQRQIDELESKGIIEKSDSPWNSPILLVPKKLEGGDEKQFRLVIDYRKLNAVTLPQSYPIPLIDEIIDQMKGAKFFTTLDLHGAFHQVPLHNSCKQYTAFSTTYEKYQFNSSPFGLVGSPFTWLKAISTVLKGLIGRHVFVYMDDIIIHSPDIVHHEIIIEEVLKKLIKNNLKLKIVKAAFFKSEVNYLGHIISSDGIKADPKKTLCMKNFPIPVNLTEMQRFLGLCNYYRRYVLNYAKIAKPLHLLCKKNNPFIWTEKCQNAFDELKVSLTTSPILIYPDFSDVFIVTTDASDYAVGAVISQGNIPHDRPIQFFSKTMNSAQINYSTIEKELLAVILAIEAFKHYLCGKEFLIITDHKPLTYLLSSKNMTGRLHRWKFCLLEYRFKLFTAKVHKTW